MACERHAGQVDKAGQDYIQHPLRVMENVQQPHAKICAVLHDILEDTPKVKEVIKIETQMKKAQEDITKTKKKDRNLKR